MENNEEIKKECHCNEECNCGNDCSCDTECHCGGECECNEEKECIKEEKKKQKNKRDKKEEINSLKNEIKELENKILLNQADMINYRKRKEEEISRMLKFANEDLVKELLPIIDTFERAIDMDDTNLDDEVSKFLAGFKMMYCNLISILEKYGVKSIDGNNKPFDPTYHQAVMTEKIDEKEQGFVIEVLQKGYLLKDKVIRPAMVKVSE